MSALDNLDPKKLWHYFDEIRKIPRASGNEDKMAEYVVSVAKQLGLEYEVDSVNNIVIRKAATPGHEQSPGVVLQCHMDMVCEKNNDKEFNFDTDPIQVKIEGEWVTADGTTLGADNGIGIAAALSILEDDTITHGPLEALFTVDEERGLVGAMNLEDHLLKGRTMINLDSEDVGIFSIGCAGGADSHIKLPLKRQSPKGDTLATIHLTGLRGGHSGIDIHEGRGNAIKIINRLLYQANKEIPLELVCIQGGDKHNAIPRETTAQVVISKQKLEDLKKWFATAIKDIQVEFSPLEKGIDVQVKQENENLPKVMDAHSQHQLLSLVFALPHGPLAMSRDIEGLVETSNNVASIKCNDKEAKLHLSSRSSNGTALQATRDKLAAIAKMAGGSIEQPEGYPGWMPNLDSPILKVSLESYKEVAGEDAKYEAIHAGLECGLIGEKYDGMDMISVGPTIKNPHSPEESVHIGSVKTFYDHVVRTIEKLA